MKNIDDMGMRLSCKENEIPEYGIKLGEVFHFQFHRHGSVGVNYEYEFDFPENVVHENTYCVYVNPENMKTGWTGGDKERCQWVFRGVKEGIIVFTVKKIFRGDLEKECKIKIQITK